MYGEAGKGDKPITPCPRCGKPRKGYARKNRTSLVYCCNACDMKHKRKRAAQLKIEEIAKRGGRCERCGFMGPPRCFDFHHRDPHTKKCVLARITSTPAWNKEVIKCDLLCANCHRIMEN